MSELKRIGRYEVVRLVGQGASGVVYEVRAGGERLALKLLAAPDPELFERFRREARTMELLSRLEHVVKIRETGDERGRPFIVMDFLEGGTLSDRVRNGPLDEREAARLLVPVARALHVMHELGVIHRDVKPQNILFDAQRRPVIADLGIARNQRDRTLTETGAVLGSVSYMAPEQADAAGKVDRRADVWALGATLYRSVTGAPPFKGTETEILKQLLLDRPAPARRARPGLSEAIDAVCARALERDPALRYATAADFARDLERVAEGEALAEPKAPASRTLPVAIGLALLLVASVLGDVVLARERGQAVGIAERSESRRAACESALAALAGSPLDEKAEAALAGATDAPARARALIDAASRAERRTPEDRERAARLVEAAFAADETTVLVDLDPGSRKSAGLALLGAMRDMPVVDAAAVTRARSRLLRARVLLPREVATREEADRVRKQWTSERGDVAIAARPFVWWQLRVAEALDAFEDAAPFDESYASGDRQPNECDVLQSVLDGRYKNDVLDGHFNPTPWCKRDAYWEALTFHPEVGSLWHHVADEASANAQWALAARCSSEALAHDPSPGAYHGHGAMLMGLGRYGQARDELARAWERSDKKDGYSGLDLVRAEFGMGQRARVQTAVTDVIEHERAKPEPVEDLLSVLNVLVRRADRLK